MNETIAIAQNKFETALDSLRKASAAKSRSIQEERAYGKTYSDLVKLGTMPKLKAKYANPYSSKQGSSPITGQRGKYPLRKNAQPSEATKRNWNPNPEDSRAGYNPLTSNPKIIKVKVPKQFRNT